MEKNWIVYKHTSPSGKVYIGITADIKDRWASQGKNYCTYNSIFRKAIEKYGWDNIQHEILLENVSKSEAIYAEKYLIRWYKAYNISYNITDGGEGTLGRKDSLETIEKRRKSLIGIKRTQEQIERLSTAHKTENAVSSSRENIKFAQTSWKGCHHSDETKKRMSENAKGRDMGKAIAASLQAHRTNAVPIIVTKNGVFVGEFEIAADIVKSLSLDKANVSRALRKGIRVNGYSINYKTA